MTTTCARFGADLERAAGVQLDARLALIVLLDQFPRDIYRRSARAFAYDAKALRLAEEGMASAEDRTLRPIERAFFYLPLEHAEDVGVQERSVAAYAALLAEAAAPPAFNTLQSFYDYAVAHRDIIRRFRQFPHRNTLLGRTSTKAEVEYLKGAGSFGQGRSV